MASRGAQISKESLSNVQGIGKEHSPGLLTAFVEQIRNKLHTSLGSASKFTEKFDRDLWQLMLTSACDPETSVPDWPRSRCPSGISSRPKCVECSPPPTTPLRRSSNRDSSQEDQLFHQGWHLVESEIDRIAGRGCIKLFDN